MVIGLRERIMQSRILKTWKILNLLESKVFFAIRISISLLTNLHSTEIGST